MSPLTMAFAKMALRGLPQMPPLLGLCLGHQALGVAEAKNHHAWDLVSFWEKSWNMIGWDGILYICMIEKYLTQPLSGIIYRPTYTYYHSHYHYHCHDQYHMMLISLSLSVLLSIYQNHVISHHFTLCRIISHHIYIYIHMWSCFFLAISPYLCTTCPTGLPQGWRLSKSALGPCHGVTEVPQVPRKMGTCVSQQKDVQWIGLCKTVQKPFHV